ncbi:MAG: hypothetical protein GY743_16920, partial [Planctomycetaceae bacterium]|nr:hypothetical protein [Planctomycetaceae bacterium]
PGTYQLTFGKPAGYEFTSADEGTDDSVDSDVDPVTGMTINEVLESGETNLDYDAGLINTTSTEIGDYVWEDKNGNGIQDAGEPPVSGVQVTLTGTTGNGTAVSQTATTDVDGLYLFSNLIPGTYQLTFGKPAGYEFTSADEGTDDSVDSDVDPVTGMTINEVLESGE